MAVNRPGVLGLFYILHRIPLSCQGSGTIRKVVVNAHDRYRIFSRYLRTMILVLRTTVLRTMTLIVLTIALLIRGVNSN